MSESSTAAGPHNAADSHDNPFLHYMHEAHGLLSNVELLEGFAHLGHEAAPGGFGLLGIPLGGLSMGLGIDEVSKGEGSQGSLDILSGGLSMTSGFAGLAGLAAAPPLAIAAGIAGLAAYGNKDAQTDGWYGNDRDGHRNTFLGSIRDRASDGHGVGVDAGRSLLGNNIVGDVAGGMLGSTLGALGGIGQTVVNSTTAFGTGVGRLASNEVDFVREHPILGSVLAPGWSGAVPLLDAAMR